jgi:hypothetical protein
MSGQLHEPAALPPENETRNVLDRRLDGAKSRSGRGDMEKNCQSLPGIEPRSSSLQPSYYIDGATAAHKSSL